MKKDNFYLAVLDIIKEQGVDEAKAFLIRRGYSEETAADYLCNVQIELQGSDEVEDNSFQNEVLSDWEKPEAPEPTIVKKAGIFNRIFG